MDIDRTAEARRKAQRNGEEDPVIVAQRFLNIFRQLHIFGEEKKKSFNQMLMSLPPEIRTIFGSLPGGATLQDYVDELTAATGAPHEEAPAAPSLSPDMVDEEVSKAKILATALAEAQIQASAKLQQSAPTLTAAPMTTAVPMAPSKVEMSGDFAKELGKALADTLKQNNESAKGEIETIIKTLGDTQLEIVRILQDENKDRKEETLNLTKMLGAAQVKIAQMASAQNQSAAAVVTEETKHLIKMLIESQQQVMQRVTKVESLTKANDNSELVKMLANSQQYFTKAVAIINQNQKESTLEVAKMINDSQQNLAQILVQHNVQNNNNGNAAANNNNNIQINSTDYSPQLTLIADRLANVQNLNGNALEKVLTETVKAQSQLFRETAAAQTRELSAIISTALQESQKISTQNLIRALKEIPQYQPAAVTAAYQYAAPENTNAAQDDAFFAPEVPAEDENPTYFPEESTENGSFANNDAFSEPAAATDYDSELHALFANDFVPAPEEDAAQEPLLTDEGNEPAAKKKKKKKKKKKNTDANSTLLSETAETQEPAAETPSQPEADVSGLEPLMPENVAENVDASEAFFAPAEEETFREEETALPETAENEVQDFFADVQDVSPAVPDEQTAEPEETASAEDFSLWNLNLDNGAAPAKNAWAFDGDTDSDAAAAKEDAGSEENDGEWLWEYEDENGNLITDATAATASEEGDGNGENWVWDYEEVPAETADGSGEDWVWDYEPADSVSATSFNTENLASIGGQNPICSGDLFFQHDVYKVDYAAAAVPEGELNIVLKDSAAAESTDNPYQNSDTKD